MEVGQGHMESQDQSEMNPKGPADRPGVAGHYARNDLLAAIRDGILCLGKTPATVTMDDLSPVDEFHIGGRRATEELVAQLQLSAADHLIDIGCGLGGAARLVADRYKCRVTGFDLTRDYVEAGNKLCEWLGLEDRVSLQHASALSIPEADGTFSGGYMLHVGMNIKDKGKLFSEAARVMRSGARFGVYDVMRTANGELGYPLPWATNPETNALAWLEEYKSALLAAGFEILAERSRKDFALTYFNQQRSRLSTAEAPAPLGLQTLMGERRPAQVRNMIEGISGSLIAPVELITRKK
jgi:ubiquinone/menaquinone biosynthesis C-methylase UbiE